MNEEEKALFHLVLYQIPPSLAFFNPPAFLEITVLRKV